MNLMGISVARGSKLAKRCVDEPIHYEKQQLELISKIVL